MPVERGRIPIAEPERARHRPVAGLRRHVEDERVGWIERDGAQQLHRRGPPSFGSSQEGTGQGLLQISPHGLVHTDPTHEEIAVVVDPPADLPLARKPAHEFACHAVKSVDLPSIDRKHQMPGKAFRHLNRARLAKTLLVQRGGKRMNAGFLLGHPCDGSDHGAKYQPARRLILFRGRRPAEPPATNKPAIDPDRIRPIDRYLLCSAGA